MDIRTIIRTSIRKWYWYAVSIIVCGLLGISSYLHKTPVYNVNAMLMLRNYDNRSSNPQDEALAIMGYRGDKTTQEEMEVLRSRALMEGVINKLDIQTRYLHKAKRQWKEQYPSHDLQATISGGDPNLDVVIDIKPKKNGYKIKVATDLFNRETVTIKNIDEPFEALDYRISLKQLSGEPLKGRYKIYHPTMLNAVAQMQKAITVSRLSRESAILKLKTSSICPDKSIDILNTLIDLYNQANFDDNNRLAVEAVEFLDKRVSDLGSELDSMSIEIENYKRTHLISRTEEAASLYMHTGDYFQREIAGTETQTEVLEYTKSFMQDSANYSNLVPSEMGIVDVALQKLINEYNDMLLERTKVQYSATDSNPVIAQLNIRIAALRENIIRTCDKLLANQSIRLESLHRQELRYTSQLASVPELERKYLEMKREMEAKEKIYLLLLNKREENAIALSSSVVAAKTIDTAQREADPISPKLLITAAASLIFGAGIPLCLIIMILILAPDCRIFKQGAQQDNNITNTITQ